MAMNTGAFLLPLLMLVAVSECAPGKITFGGQVGFRNHLNATAGFDAEGEIDGLSISGGAKAIGGIDLQPELIGKAYAGIGDNIAGVDGSLKGDIGGTWQPGFTGALGRDSNGTYKAKFVPYSSLDNKLVIDPKLDLLYGEDAKKTFVLGSDSGNEDQKQAAHQELAPEPSVEDESADEALTEEELAELARELRARKLLAQKQRAQQRRSRKQNAQSQGAQVDNLQKQVSELQQAISQLLARQA